MKSSDLFINPGTRKLMYHLMCRCKVSYGQLKLSAIDLKVTAYLVDDIGPDRDHVIIIEGREYLTLMCIGKVIKATTCIHIDELFIL